MAPARLAVPAVAGLRAMPTGGRKPHPSPPGPRRGRPEPYRRLSPIGGRGAPPAPRGGPRGPPGGLTPRGGGGPPPDPAGAPPAAPGPRRSPPGAPEQKL